MRRLQASLLALVTVAGAVTGGCRCNDETLAPVDFENAQQLDLDPNSVLAPPWQPPEATQLSNDAVLHWLEEPGSPAFHLRLLLPTAVDSGKLSAAATATVLEALRMRLDSRLRRIRDARVDFRSRPGRVEVAIHGRDSDAIELIEALTTSMADAGNPKLLAVAQGKVLARHREAGPAALATAALAAELLDHPLAHEYAAKRDLVELSRKNLERGWSLLTNPRDALLVVHAGRPLDDEELSAALTELGERWQGPISIGSGTTAATGRLREPAPKRRANTYLLSETKSAPLPYYLGKPEHGNRAVVMVGRLLPTPTPEDRALARLCQRLLQEEIDARLLVAGPVSLLAIKVRVSSNDPVLSLERTFRKIQAFATEPAPQNRLTQATQLWLGARVIEASLAGEDWTALWSESIDLAAEDREIYFALARDAQAMLGSTPEQVQAFFAQWFDPQSGEPGWIWVAAGINDNFKTKLGEAIKLVPAD